MTTRPAPRCHLALTALAALSILPACGDTEFTAAKSFDFIAAIRQAEIVCRGAPLDPNRFLGPKQPWTEDDRLFCPALPRTDIRFREVPLGEDAVLHVGFGLHPNFRMPENANPEGRLRFRVVFQARGTHVTLMERDLPPGRFAGNPILEERLPLPEVDAASGDFLFHSDAGRGMENIRAVWCGLVLKSQGRKISADEAAVTFRRGRGSLLDAALTGERAGEGTFFRADFDEENRVFQRRQEGRILLTVPPAAARFRIPSRPDTRLGLGMAAASLEGEPKGEVLFQVKVDGRKVLEETLSTGKAGVPRRAALPLPFEEGEEVEIELRTSIPDAGGKNGQHVAALWIHPVIEETLKVPRRSAGDGKSVVVLVVDALRADHMSLYGYGRATTPNLDRAAERGIVFDNAWAQSSWTIPSTATLLTGQYSYTHGLYDAYHWFLVPGIETVTAAFLRSGFTTAAFVANHLVSEDTNFANHFEAFHASPFCTAAQLNRMFLHWLDGREGERFFAYLHYMEPHLPYAAPGGFLQKFRPEASRIKPDPDRSELILEDLKKRLADLGAPPDPEKEIDAGLQARTLELLDLYDGEIAYWDDQFGGLIAEVEERGLLDDILFVITSDHGEEFLDHGQFLHGQNLHRELLHVPLVLLDAGRPPARRKDMAGLLDLAPTLLSLSGIPYGNGDREGPGFAGADLFGSPPSREFLFAETAHGMRRMGADNEVMRGVFSDTWKGILTPKDGRLRLYHLQEDRTEIRDLAGTESGMRDRMIDLISEWVHRSRASAPYNISLFNASALEKLREMGYLK